MVKVFLAIASILAGLSVALGAFASHGLKDKLTERALEIFETATRYQMCNECIHKSPKNTVLRAFQKNVDSGID
jgi:uncharacterized membrane protein YgdD (TMEM256/DUF423 family)